MPDPKLDELLTRASQAFMFKGLPSDKKILYQREQTISWVYGEMKLIGNPMSWEEIAQVYDELHKCQSKRRRRKG